eukprot:scaffold125056_cov30-Tisochrysis_lutea.AAC.1
MPQYLDECAAALQVGRAQPPPFIANTCVALVHGHLTNDGLARGSAVQILLLNDIVSKEPNE